MKIEKALAAATSAAALAIFGSPFAHAAGGPSCLDWGNYMVCRTMSFDVTTGQGTTIDCYYYQDGSSECK